MARYPWTTSSSNHLKGGASRPPMIITISSVSLMSGSQPRFPPGELSNRKPKSEKQSGLTNVITKTLFHEDKFVLLLIFSSGDDPLKLFAGQIMKNLYIFNAFAALPETPWAEKLHYTLQQTKACSAHRM